MSQEGVFQLITNTGIQSNLIYNFDLLQQSICSHAKHRTDKLTNLELLAQLQNEWKAKGNSLSTFPNVDLESVDYKTRRKNIAAQIMEKTTDWLPTIQDIEKTHIMYVNSTFKPIIAMASSYRKVGANGQSNTTLGSKLTFTVPVNGEFVNDMVVNLKLVGLHATLSQDKVRYVELLGHKLFKRTSFKMRNNLLDEYTPEVANVALQHHIPIGKEEGYLRMIGQEVKKEGFLTADAAVDEVREYRYFGDGPQTFKTIQPTLDLWIPLHFWFKDIRTPLPNFMVPYGETNVEIELESDTNLIAYANYSLTTGPVYVAPVLRDCNLYVNHLYFAPEIYKLFRNRVSEQLIRVHRLQTVSSVTRNSDSILLNSLKWPVEQMYVAFRPTANLSNSQKWHRNAAITTNNVKEAVVTGVATIQVNTASYFTETPVVSTLSLTASSIPIYPEAPLAFYNSYLNYRFGASYKCPQDLGWALFNFAQKPDEPNPSGHFDSSNDREMYLSYTAALDSSNTPLISADNPCDIIIVAQCLNVLTTKDRMAVLKYST